MSSPDTQLSALWASANLPMEALPHARLSGSDPVLPSSMAVGTAAQVTVAAAALAACELGHARGQARQDVSVNMQHAALEFAAWCAIDGRVPPTWDPFSGVYRCADGWVRVHANFAHHRDGALRLLGLKPGEAQRADAERALLRWRAQEYEQAAAEQGLVVAATRPFDEWDRHPQGRAIANQPLITIERIGDADPISLSAIDADDRPFTGARVLDLTRILAGPTCSRALAAYGADVMLINSPHLPNIELVAATSMGKLSAHADLRTDAGRHSLDELLRTSHVFVQGYRPEGLAELGYGPEAVARARPGIVYVSLSAYGNEGPWRARRGFDSLVQAAMGFNLAEAEAAGVSQPKAMPLFALDCSTGFLMAFAVAAMLRRQEREGGSWHVHISLARVGHWLRGLGRIDRGMRTPFPDHAPYVEVNPSGFGEISTIRHSASFSRTPPRWSRPSVPPGTSPPQWP